MRYSIFAVISFATVLSACGGSGSSSTEMMQQEMEQRDRMDAPSLNFTEFLTLDSTQLAGVDPSDAGTFSEFAKANVLPVGFYTDPSASFNGSMIVQMGETERYYSGAVDLTINFTNGTGRGTVGFGSISGNDVQNHETNISLIDMNITKIDGSSLEGTIKGDVDVSFEINPDLLDTYTFDTTFGASFVDDGIGGGFLGTVAGSVTSGNRGEETVNGVIVAGRDLFR